MKYIDIGWKHKNATDPVRFASELNDEYFEVRKLEFFSDGEVGHAWLGGSTMDTALSQVAIPPLTEINLDPQFEGAGITAQEFENLWKKHTVASST